MFSPLSAQYMRSTPEAGQVAAAIAQHFHLEGFGARSQLHALAHADDPHGLALECPQAVHARRRRHCGRFWAS